MKSTSKTRLALTALALGAAALVGGCWNDDDDEGTPAPLTQVPASAGASIAAYVAFIKGLVSDETSEPLSLDGFKAPADETSEPLPAS